MFAKEIERYLGDTYVNVHKSVVAYARRLVGDSLAEDVVQEAFLRILTYCRGKDRAMTWAFIFAVTRNVARTLMAERKRAQAGMDDLAHGLDECCLDSINEDKLPARISAEISSLPERQREALMLTEVHGLSENQAALILRMSRAAVGARRRAALRRLREVAA